jgi:putative ABC transport system substrate-binding protein
MTADPVAAGFAASLARPGGNITGVSVDVGDELEGKRLEILKEAVPKTSRVAFLAPRHIWEGTSNVDSIHNLREVARHLGVTLVGAPLDSPIQEPEYRRVFAAMAKEHVDALLVSDVPDNFTHRRLIVELVEKARLPAIYPWLDFVEIGGLMAYVIDLKEVWRRAADQVGQILKGAHPGEVPIYQPTTFELIINLKTARALSIEMPPLLLARADEVIE